MTHDTRLHSFAAAVAALACALAPFTPPTAQQQPRWRWESGVEDPRREWLTIAMPESIVPKEQPTNMTCAPTTLDIEARYFEAYEKKRFGLDVVLPCFQCIHRGVTETTTARKFNIRDFVSTRTVTEYWNKAIAPTAGGWSLREHQGHTIEELLDAVEKTRLPVTVSYVMPFGAAGIANFGRDFFRIVTLGLSEIVVEPLLPIGKDGERILHGYLHASVLVGFSRFKSDQSDLTLYLADPWTGRLTAWDAKTFLRMWTDYESVDSSEFYQRTMKPAFYKLAPPGTYLTFEQVSELSCNTTEADK